MSAPHDAIGCPVLGKLVALLEMPRADFDEEPRFTFQKRLAEIELDALLLNAPPATRVFVQVAREVVTFSERLTGTAARA